MHFFLQNSTRSHMGVVLQMSQEANYLISQESIWCSTDLMPILHSMDMLPFFFVVATPETNRHPCICITVIFCWSLIRSEKYEKNLRIPQL